MTTLQNCTSTRRSATQRNLAAEGYSVAETIFCKGLYEVRRPDGRSYFVSIADNHCTCPATVADCCHIRFVRRCLRFVSALDRKPTMTSASKTARIPRYGARRVSAWRRVATTVTEIYPPASLDADPDAYLSGMVAKGLGAIDAMRREHLREDWQAHDEALAAFCSAVLTICAYLGAEYEDVSAALKGFRGGVGAVASVRRLVAAEEGLAA